MKGHLSSHAADLQTMCASSLLPALGGPEQFLMLCSILQPTERWYQCPTCLLLLAHSHCTGGSSKSKSKELASIEIPSPPKGGRGAVATPWWEDSAYQAMQPSSRYPSRSPQKNSMISKRQDMNSHFRILLGRKPRTLNVI